MIILPLYPHYIPHISQDIPWLLAIPPVLPYSAAFFAIPRPVQSQSAAFAPERVRCVRGQWRCDPQWKLKAQRMVCANREIYVYRCLLPMEATVLSMENYECFIIEGSLEVKLPTIWTDEKQSRAEAERRERLEERRVEEKESEERRCRCTKR